MDAEIDPERDYLFISYAWEDVALAEWLAYKLTGFGYKVWCDRIKLFGGESFPREIDNAIKNRTFRLLALLSPASIDKPNPTKERTLALAIAKERKIDFMIPLNLGLRATELNWMLSDLTYIDFQTNWADGLAQLLKALDKAKASRALANGRDVVVASLLPSDLTVPGSELLHSNLFPVLAIPDVLTSFYFYQLPGSLEREAMGREWPGYRINGHTFVAFQPPPAAEDHWRHKIIDADRWREKAAIHGVPSRNIVSNLIQKCLRVQCLKKGMKVTDRGDWLHMPKGLLPGDKTQFIGLDGKKTWVSVVGERSFFRPGQRSEPYQHFLAPVFIIRQDLGAEFMVRLFVRVHVANRRGKSYPPHSAHARRKAATKDWWNWEWGNRHLAVMQFLAGGKDEIVIGDRPEHSLRIAAFPLGFVSAIKVADDEIDKRRKERIEQAKRGGAGDGGSHAVQADTGAQ